MDFITSKTDQSPSNRSATSPYPYATAPDIIRSHQKDAYFTGTLTNTLTDLHRRLLGARSAHGLAPELKTLASLLYFSLTTLPGNRTLGEEYCDLVQIEGKGGRLPGVARRGLYILGTVLLPYFVGRGLPGLRVRLRKVLERRVAALKAKETDGRKSKETRLWEYALHHLSSITSAAPIQAVTLAIFYFTGTYYELSKRVLSLRYVFTRNVEATGDRSGYQVLGALLVAQLAVQGYLHVRSTLASGELSASRERNAFDLGSDVSMDHDTYSANNALLPGGEAAGAQMRVDIAATTHTPVSAQPKVHLAESGVMGYIKGAQQRKCTLCLEELKDPAATQCGHVFCWECIGDWVREKPECPLCRSDCLLQHILPLRTE